MGRVISQGLPCRPVLCSGSRGTGVVLLAIQRCFPGLRSERRPYTRLVYRRLTFACSLTPAPLRAHRRSRHVSAVSQSPSDLSESVPVMRLTTDYPACIHCWLLRDHGLVSQCFGEGASHPQVHTVWSSLKEQHHAPYPQCVSFCLSSAPGTEVAWLHLADRDGSPTVVVPLITDSCSALPGLHSTHRTATRETYLTPYSRCAISFRTPATHGSHEEDGTLAKSAADITVENPMPPTFGMTSKGLSGIAVLALLVRPH